MGIFLDTDRFCVLAIKKKSAFEVSVIFVTSLKCLNAAFKVPFRSKRPFPYVFRIVAIEQDEGP